MRQDKIVLVKHILSSQLTAAFKPSKKFECYYVNDVIYFICSKNLTYFCNEIRNITICKRESSSEM